jgi:sialate O-acetylesterase
LYLFCLRRRLGGSVPIGLISSNWPGTSVQSWTPNSAYLGCCSRFPAGKGHGEVGNACASQQGGLFNDMISPFAHGPMALQGFSWYQGESNTVANNASLPYNAGARFYACCFPAMISAWRKAFEAAEEPRAVEGRHQSKLQRRHPELFFGFVQLSTFL